MGKQRRLQDAYRFAGLRPLATVRGVFGDPKARIVVLVRRRKKRPVAVWTMAAQLLRPPTAVGAGPVVRRHADVSGCGSAPRGLPEMRGGEARTAGVAGRQSVLHQAICLLRGTAVSGRHDQGCGRGAASGLGLGQDAGEAVHARAVAPRGYAGTTRHRDRRDLDPQRAHVPDRGQRPGSARPIWFGGTDRSEASMDQFFAWLGPKKCKRMQSGGDGHVEGVSQLHQAPRAAGQHPVRQVPRHAPPRRCPGYGAQARVRAAERQRPTLHQGAEVHAAVAPGEPHAGRPPRAQAAVGGQQAAEHGLPAQGVLRPAVGLPARRLGATLLRELEGGAEVAAAQARTRSSPR